MVKIDIFSGFLGAGKTTLIKKLLKEAYAGEKVVLIENEFGEIGVDGGFLKEAGIEITEMNSGCICCSLVGDFAKALTEVAEKFSPDRIIIEPSGVGKLSDVIKAVQKANVKDSRLNAFCTVVDAKKCKTYLKNFGEFFLDQVEHASCIVLSHTSDPAKTQEAAALLKEHTNVTLVTTDWAKLSGQAILSAMQQTDSLNAELNKLESETHEHHHHHHHHDHGEKCECGCHHDHEHEHHHHDHEHEHDEHCTCGCHDHEHEHEHDHEHHHHHHADEIFTSWGIETAKQFTKEELEKILGSLSMGEYGEVLRAKGIVDGGKEWLYFDYVPGEADVRSGNSAVTGRLCVIGCKLNEDKLQKLFLG
ncbi:MAG: GTP-binding protein [Clostridia bacterium]|nr:GTP-binding protein [Clostridia bacterium]